MASPVSLTVSDVETALLELDIQEAEQSPIGWRFWLRELFPEHVPYEFAPHHELFWNWLWSIEHLKRPSPFVACWPRGGAKSTSGEMGMVALGARDIRKYCLYISETQDQADDHVGNVGAMMEGQSVYPSLGEKLVGKHGNPRGWRRNRLMTSTGFTVDALGLDTAARGMKLDEQRPDAMWFDDIDSEDDTDKTTEKKIRTITRRLLPAAGKGMAVLFIQNLVKEGGVMDQMLGPQPPFLADAITSGPIPALTDMVSVGNHIITGEPTWEGQNLARCQEMVDDMMMSSFLAECQHDVQDLEGGMFNHVEFRHEEYSPELLRSLDRVVCWVDPAVTDTDRSDANGIQIDGKRGRVLYRLFSWEKRSSPLETLKVAITKAIEYGAQHVGVEVDQGGDLWRSEYTKACEALGKKLGSPYGSDTWAPPFTSERAGAGFGSKQERAQRMLVDYESERIIHVLGTHEVLERSLKRFPLMKPYDLVDASFWSWNDLNRGDGKIHRVAHPTRGGGVKHGEFFPMHPERLSGYEQAALLDRERRIERDEDAVRKTRKMIERMF